MTLFKSVITLKQFVYLLAVVKLSASSTQNFPCAAKMSLKDNVGFEEVKSLSQSTNCDALIIDVREPQELKETGVIPRSINIPCN